MPSADGGVSASTKFAVSYTWSTRMGLPVPPHSTAINWRRSRWNRRRLGRSTLVYSVYTVQGMCSRFVFSFRSVHGWLSGLTGPKISSLFKMWLGFTMSSPASLDCLNWTGIQSPPVWTGQVSKTHLSELDRDIKPTCLNWTGIHSLPVWTGLVSKARLSEMDRYRKPTSAHVRTPFPQNQTCNWNYYSQSSVWSVECWRMDGTINQ